MKTLGQIAYEAMVDRKSIRQTEFKGYSWGEAITEERLDFEAAAEAVKAHVLANLPSPWRDLKVDPPKATDAVIMAGGHALPGATTTTRGCYDDRTHWMPIPPLPEPAEEQESRAEFEAAWSRIKCVQLNKNDAWEVWQAARKEEESK